MAVNTNINNNSGEIISKVIMRSNGGCSIKNRKDEFNIG